MTGIPDFMRSPVGAPVATSTASVHDPASFATREQAPEMNAPEPGPERAPPPPFVPGVFRDMPAEQYHAVEAMSSSGARSILRSPAHFVLWRTERRDPSAAMQFGTAVHAGVLEPERFDRVVVMAPEFNARTAAGKADRAAFVAANAGRVILSADDFDRARRCVDAIRAHPAARALLDGAECELSLFWRDAQFGVPCKARLDARNHGGIIDLKTTTDASPEEFARSVASWGYHRQAAHYVSGCEHLLDGSPEFFAFIAAESEPPHGVACYSLPGAAILAGAHSMNRALERYAAALAAGEWPGYPSTVESLTLPKWAMRFDN